MIDSNRTRKAGPPPIPARAIHSSRANKRKKKKRRTLKPGRLLFVLLLFILMVTGLSTCIGQCVRSPASEPADLWAISDNVWQYESMLDQAVAENGIPEYKDILLCIMQTESAGLGEDVMQASESLDLPLNSLNPQDSINQGTAFFASLLEKGNRLGVDLDTVIQAYNYGSGFIDYVYSNGGKYSMQLSEAFSREHSNNIQVPYSNEISDAYNGGTRWNYGNMFYTQLVDRYLQKLQETRAESDLESQTS